MLIGLNDKNSMMRIGKVPFCYGTYDGLSYETALALYVNNNDIENIKRIIDSDLIERNIELLPKLVEISTENEYHEITAFLLDYQYKHNLFKKKEWNEL